VRGYAVVEASLERAVHMYSAKSQVKSSHFKSQRRPHSICECIDPNVFSDPCSDRRHAGNECGNESPHGTPFAEHGHKTLHTIR
jgi:hypothetical protein